MSAANASTRAVLSLAASVLPVLPLRLDKRPACSGIFYRFPVSPKTLVTKASRGGGPLPCRVNAKTALLVG
jgi:hypothetical protein